jgi:hypothetical protein
MATMNKVTFKLKPCSITFVVDNMVTKLYQHEHRCNSPGGGLKQKVATKLPESINGGPCITTWYHVHSLCRCRGVIALA